MLSYLLHISFYLVLKSSGAPVKDHPVVQQLVKLRIFMEKVKPIDQKLKSQINRLLKLASEGIEGTSVQGNTVLFYY
jgi:hypothetical protein